jgi:flavin reductase (DIM6/NTAB) family NADH-FMN oxidoreductase RutF
MNATQFKDLFAAVPRPVVVVGLVDGDKIFGVTISSLQTVSVDDHHQVLSFTLRKNSFFASKITQSSKISINILSSSQFEISEFYSNPNRNNEEHLQFNTWKLSGENNLSINDSYLSASVALINSFDFGSSTIYFVSMEELLSFTKSDVLVYGNRTYGAFVMKSTK